MDCTQPSHLWGDLNKTWCTSIHPSTYHWWRGSQTLSVQWGSGQRRSMQPCRTVWRLQMGRLFMSRMAQTLIASQTVSVLVRLYLYSATPTTSHVSPKISKPSRMRRGKRSGPITGKQPWKYKGIFPESFTRLRQGTRGGAASLHPLSCLWWLANPRSVQHHQWGPSAENRFHSAEALAKAHCSSSSASPKYVECCWGSSSTSLV